MFRRRHEQSARLTTNRLRHRSKVHRPARATRSDKPGRERTAPAGSLTSWSDLRSDRSRQRHSVYGPELHRLAERYQPQPEIDRPGPFPSRRPERPARQTTMRPFLPCVYVIGPQPTRQPEILTIIFYFA